MSYDLTFKRGKNAPLSPKQRDALAAALCKIHRPLKLFKLNFAQIAKQLKITEVAAREQFDNSELNDAKSGLQVNIFAKEATVAIPFSLKPKQAKQTFAAIGKLGEAFTEAGFTCRDSQLGRKVNFEKDVDAMLDCYSTTVKELDEISDLSEADFAALIQAFMSQAEKKKKKKKVIQKGK
jgi:hypothetical protein